MPFVLAPLIAGGLGTLGVGAATATAIAPFLSSFVLAAGAAAASLLLASRPPKPDDGKISIQQSIPPRIYAYGTVRLAGAIMVLEENVALYHVAALCDHKVSAFVAFYLNEDVVTLTGDFVDEGDDGRYKENQIRLFYRFGNVPETAYSEVTAAFPGRWPSSARGDGIASLCLIADDVKPENFQEIYPHGRPMPSAVMDTALVYDPRDVAQDPDDPDTWEFSRNAALCIVHFMCFSEFGPGFDYDVAFLPVLADLIEEIDICDEPVDLKAGGTEPRYHLSGWSVAGPDYKSTLIQMLLACDGWWCQRPDGAIILRVGKFRDKGVTLTDDDISGYSYQRGMADEEAVNRIVPTFTSPLHHYSEIDCDALDDTVDQTARGLLRDLPYPLLWCRTFTSARRIAKREMIRQMEPLRGTLDLKLSGTNAVYERWIKIESSIPALNDRFIENRASRFALTGAGLRMEFQGSGSEIDDYDENVDEGEAPPLPDGPLSIPPPQPENVAVDSETYSSGGSTNVRLIVTFDDPPGRPALTFKVRWRVKDTDLVTIGNQPGPWFVEDHGEVLTAVAGRFTVYTGPVQKNSTLEVEVASIAPRGTVSAWSATVTVDSSAVQLADDDSILLTDDDLELLIDEAA